MEHQKAFKLLNEADDSKFVTRKWMTYDQWIVNDQSNGNYDVRNEIIYITKIDGKKNRWYWRLRLGHADVQFIIVQLELSWHNR